MLTEQSVRGLLRAGGLCGDPAGQFSNEEDLLAGSAVNAAFGSARVLGAGVEPVVHAGELRDEDKRTCCHEVSAVAPTLDASELPPGGVAGRLSLDSPRARTEQLSLLELRAGTGHEGGSAGLGTLTGVHVERGRCGLSRGRGYGRRRGSGCRRGRSRSRSSGRRSGGCSSHGRAAVLRVADLSAGSRANDLVVAAAAGHRERDRRETYRGHQEPRDVLQHRCFSFQRKLNPNVSITLG